MKKILFLAFALPLFSCSAKSPDTANAPAGTSASVANDSIPFPVYMSYREFEPHLLHENDTTYVINFWATWCKPCVEEMPLFEKLIQATAGPTGTGPTGVDPTGAGQPVKVLMVSMDFPKDIQKKLVPFVAEHKLESHVVALGDLDYNSWIDKVSTDWDGAIPFTLVYNKKGRVAKMGQMANYEELEKLVESLMD